MFALLLSLALVPAATPAVAESLTAQDVAQRARERDPLVQASFDAVALAEAARVGAGLFANPRVSWERERTGDGDEASVGEDSLALALPIDLSSRRRTRMALADANVAEATAAALRTRSAVVARALDRFFSMVAERRRADAERAMVAGLDEASRVVARRRDEGTASDDVSEGGEADEHRERGRRQRVSGHGCVLLT